MIQGAPALAPLPDRGLGEVYRAFAPDDPRDVLALKLLGPAEAAHDARFTELLRRLRALSTAAIPNVREGGVRDGRRFVVVDLPDFDDLRSLASYIDGHREAGTLPHWSTAFSLFNALALALDDGARAGHPHRGLSPASALLRPLGPTGPWQLWLVDFELAPWIRDPATAPSPRYLPPEPHARSLADHRRGDVFSLAVTFCELLTGADGPPGTPAPWNAFVRHRHAEVPAALASLRGDVPTSLWRVVAAALHPDPARRPADAGEFAARVRAAGRTEGIHRDVPLPEAPPPLPVGARRAAARDVAASEPVGWVRPERAPVPTGAREDPPLDETDVSFGPGSRSLWAPSTLPQEAHDTLPPPAPSAPIVPSPNHLVPPPNDLFAVPGDAADTIVGFDGGDTLSPDAAEVADAHRPTPSEADDPTEATLVYETGESRAAVAPAAGDQTRIASPPALVDRDAQATLPMVAPRGAPATLPLVRPQPRHATVRYEDAPGPRSLRVQQTLLAAPPSRPPAPPLTQERTIDATLPVAPPTSVVPIPPRARGARPDTSPSNGSVTTLRWVVLTLLAGVVFMAAYVVARGPRRSSTRTDPHAVVPARR